MLLNLCKFQVEVNFNKHKKTMVWFEYCLNCIVNMLILAHKICSSWNPCNNYIVIKASVFYTTKPINPVICLMMNLYIASFRYHNALSWLMELKFSSQKSMSITSAILNSNKACVYFLSAKTLQTCILYIQINTTPISFHIETSLINSIEISDIYIRIKGLSLPYTDQFPSVRQIIHTFALNTGSSCF